MGHYDSLFIKSLISEFPFSINDTFYLYRKQLKIELSLEDYIDELLNETFNNSYTGCSTNESVKKLKKKVLNRRRYIYTSMRPLLDAPLVNTSNPLHHLISLSPKEKLATYYTQDDYEILKNFISEMDNWNKDKRSLLVNFPLYDKLKPAAKLDCLSLDILISAWDYIALNFNGDINNSNLYALPALLGFSELPAKVFTTRIPAGESFSLVCEKETEDGKYTLKIHDIKEDIEPVKTEDVIRLRDYLFHIVENNFTILTQNNNAITLELDDSCKVLTNERIRDKHRERVKKVWRYVRHVDLQFEARSSSNISGLSEGNYSLINDFEFFSMNGTEYITVNISSYLIKQVLSKNLVSIQRTQYDILEGSLAKIIVHPLALKKINSVPDEDGYVYIHVTFFYNNAKFLGTHAENMLLISNALNEMIDKTVLIKEFSLLDNDTFRIRFY